MKAVVKERYKGHKLTIKNLCFTAIPAIIFPLIDIMPIDEISKIGFTVIAIGFVGWQVLKISLCEEKDEYSCAMKSHFRKFGNQMSGSGNHLCKYTSLLA